MNIERILGFVLLVVGVGLILYSLFASYGIFTGSQEAPEIFSDPVGNEIETSADEATASADVQQQLQSLMQEQLKGILPEGTIPKTLNLFAWSIFTGILIFGGGQIAGIGVKLLRK